MAARPDIYWLASYPKSGNTWVRFLLVNLLYGPQESTAELERQLPDLHEARDLQELLGAGRRLIKSHLMLSPAMPLRPLTRGYVYVVRNPLDVLASNLNYLFLQSFDQLRKLDAAGRAAFAGRYVEDYIAHRGDPRWVRFGMGSWTDHWRSWNVERHGLPGLMLRYEDLLSHPAREAARVCEFLELDCDEAAIARAVAASSFDRMRAIEEAEVREKRPGFFYKSNFQSGHRSGLRFMNRGRSGTAKTRLTAEQLSRAEEAFRRPMRQLGYLDDDGPSIH